jgi:hypothetical protein
MNLSTILKKLTVDLEEMYQLSLKLVRKEPGLSPNLFPHNFPHSLEQLLDDNWYPEK